MTEKDQMNLYEARNSSTGKALTNSQFDEVWSIVGIMKRGIGKTGSFREKLTDYAHAFARSERFDAMRGESIIRDIYSARYGQTMNQTREALLDREKSLQESGKDQALHHARSIEGMIKEGETMPFYRAYDNAALAMAEQHNITESGAKEMMKTAYREIESKELYETGKALEKAHHEPVKEARKETEHQTRTASRNQAKSRVRA